MNTWVKLDCTNGILRLLSYPAQLAYKAICNTWQEDVYITSLTEGRHLQWSRHYVGDALDVLSPRKNRAVKVAKLKKKLGEDYTVLDEGNHVHVAYKPRI